MPTIFKRKKGIYGRFALWLIFIGFFSLSPLIIGIIGAWFIEWKTGQPCHEGNCSWGALPWLTLMTMPIGFLLFGIILIIFLLDLRALNKQQG